MYDMTTKRKPKSIDEHVPGLTQKQAWDRVAAEVRAGRLVQPGACQVCDAKEKVWGHHWRGYEYPLDVWWVCSSCNRLLTVHDGTQTLEQARAAMPSLKVGPGEYATYKDRQAAKSRERSITGRDIGPLPAVVDPARRAACEHDLGLFNKTYFPRRFTLPFADSHRIAIARMETCTNDGGLFACAMPRGEGKTTLADCAILRAILYGRRRFVVLIPATEKHAARALKRLQAELETNDLLAEDFPEVCHPIRRLERIHNRAKGQTLGGEPTRIVLTAETMVLPTVAGAASSGAVVQVASLTGSFRGLSWLGPDGQPMRPDLVVIDDAQTRESARSPTQTAQREQTILDDVLGLAGPTTTIAAIMLCTVIYPDDLSDRFLSPERHPEWQGVRTKMLIAFPANLALWDQYAEIRRESFRSGDKGARATALYAANRAAMDAGAVVAWPERKKAGELSGIQSAMNCYIDNPRGFRAEYQNDPDRGDLGAGAKELLPAAIAGRLSGAERLMIPREAVRLTAFVDCGAAVLWYLVVAWTERFGGAVVDYGTWPRQARTVFAASDVRPGLADVYAGHTEEQRVYAGLGALTTEILGRAYYRETTGEEVRIERCLVDCGWLSKTVYQFVRASPFAGVIYPSKGIGRSTTARGVSEWKPRAGERSGHHWRLTVSETGKGRMVQFDPDAWKSFLHAALTTPLGGPTGLSLWGRSAAQHELIAEHCAAEYSTPVTIRGNTFDHWEVRPDRPDNHLWDCLVGAAVAASVAGVAWTPSADGPAPAPASGPQRSQAELQAEARRRGPANRR